MKLIRKQIPFSVDQVSREHWLTAFFHFAAISLGALHTWAAVTRYSMNADGISYLDIGDAYMRGDWHNAISSVWSPMYSWILGLVTLVIDPPMRWEFPVVQIVNFVIYLVALVCFGFFWRKLSHYRNTRTARSSGGTSVGLPEWAWLSLGYTLFLVASLHLIQIWSVTPDMLMSAFVYLAAGLVLRVRIGSATLRSFILLGIVLGLGFLAKAIMFPLGFILLAVALLSAGDTSSTGPRVLAALVVFLLLCLPFIALVSVSEGEFTISDVGTLTYARYVNRVPYPHWQGGSPGNGLLEHPSRKILETPPIYEFGTPIGGTYPISYDPSYWYEGIAVRLDLKQQLDYILFSGLFYLDLFFRQQAGLTFGVLLLYFVGRRQSLRVVDMVSSWGLIIPALVIFGFYGLVCIAGRYVGVFVVLFWADLVANVRLPDSLASRRLAHILGSVMVLFMLINLVILNLEGFRDLTEKGNLNVSSNQQALSPSWPGEVAEELHDLGIQQGDKVAVIGYGFDSFWARLARVQIVAEMPVNEGDPFWLGDPALQSEVVQAFASTGAQAIVAEKVPSHASLTGWRQVGNSNYYINLLE